MAADDSPTYLLFVAACSPPVRDPARYAKTIKACFEMVSTGKLVPMIYDTVYDGLEDLPRGLGDLENRKVWGKAVVRIRPDDTNAKARL
jgi:NADPH2:quinone reductase